MYGLFIELGHILMKLINISINASWLVLTVVLLRLLMKKAPKWASCILWGLVAIRLAVPVSVESMLSLIPSSEPLPVTNIYNSDSNIANNHYYHHVDSGVKILDAVIDPLVMNTTTSALRSNMSIVACIWLVGIVAMILYAVITYIRLYKKVCEGVVLKDNIYLCDRISTPFILGLFRPRIFLPSSMNEADMEYVIAHEKVHMKRFDHLWKPLGFTLLTVYWFNPVIWLAYILLCRDIELACDEKVIKEMGAEIKKPYSEALINCSVSRKTVSACPLAFGEVNVKNRIRSVLSYKKPAFWVILIAVVSCVIVAVCFLTNPIEPTGALDNIVVTGSGSENDIVTGEIISAEIFADKPYIEIKWTNHLDKDLMTSEEFYLYQLTDNDLVDRRLRPDLYTWNDVEYIIPANGSFTKKYSLEDMIIKEPAELLFEAHFSIIDGSQNLNMWVDFLFGETDFFYDNQYLKAEKIVYENLASDYAFLFEKTPEYQISGTTLFERVNEASWLNLGLLEQITLDEEHFESRLYSENEHPEFYTLGCTLDEFKAENVKAWELKINRRSSNELFIIMKQSNGDYYMAFGNHSQEWLNRNDDSSIIQYICKMEHVFTSTEMPNTNADGLIVNYESETSQFTIGRVDEPIGMSFSDYTKITDVVLNMRRYNYGKHIS